MRAMFERLKAKARWVVAAVVALVAPMWAAEFVDSVLFVGGLDRFGVRPRHLDGAWGVLFAPLLHGGVDHLGANTVGLVLLGGFVAAIGRRQWMLATALGWVGSGVGIWLFGSSGTHIGASGVVFAYLGFLLLRGWYERSLGSVVVSLGVFSIFGGTLWGMVPIVAGEGVSWEGHLFGFLSGAAAAALLRRRHLVGSAPEAVSPTETSSSGDESCHGCRRPV